MGWISLVDTNSSRRASYAGFRQLFDLRPMKQKRSKLGYELAVRRFKACTLSLPLGSGGRPPAGAKSIPCILPQSSQHGMKLIIQGS